MSIKNFRERSPFLIGIISILAITAGTTFSFYIDKIPAIKQAYDISAEFANAAGLKPENQVRVAGIKVGTVSSVELDGDRVVVNMEIENGVEIPEGSAGEIKLATLLGTKFVEIKAQGGAPFLEEGDVIPLEDTSVPYEIFEAANQGTNVLEDLNGPLLNKLLVELTDITRITKEELGSALDGLNLLGSQLNARDDELTALLADSDDLTKLLSDEGDEIVRLIDASDELLGVLAQRREEIQSLLESTKVMAGDLTAVVRDNRSNLDAILDRLHRALLVLDKNVKHIDVALEYAGPSSRYLASVFTQGRWGDIFSCALIVSASCEQDE